MTLVRGRFVGQMSLILVLLAVLVSPSVFAQPDSAASSAPSLEEVVVVAQKREQDNQDVPLAISVFDAESIENSGMQTLTKLTDLDPSVSFETAQSFQRSSLKIRGIGTIGNSRSFEGAVGVFIDGVYRPRSGMALGDLLDIDSIEVMRGPQSTLYGKNTVAGAIVLHSVRPDFDELHGDIELRAGDYDDFVLTGAINAPLTDSLALRFAATHDERDGFFKSPDTGDTYDAVHRYGIKGQLLFQPSDDLEVLAIVDHSKSDTNCCWGSAIAVNGPTIPLIAAFSELNGLSFTAAPEGEKTRAQSLNTLPGEKIEDSGLTTTINWNFGGNTLQSVTSVRDWKHRQIMADADFVGADLFILSEPAQIRTASQEVNITIPLRERDDLLVGLYIGKEEYDSTRFVQTGSDADNYLNSLISAGAGATSCLPPIVAVDCVFPVGVGALLDDGEFSDEYYFQDSRTLGVFGHGTFALFDKFQVVAGLRYSKEKKDGGVDNLFWYDSPIARAALEANGIPDDGTPRNGLDIVGTVYSPSFKDATRENELTGTASLQYFHSDWLMAYAGYHRGYKAGGVNLFREGVVSNTTTYKPEFAESIEVGLKTNYWNNRARTNLGLFHTEFTDLQINFFTGLEFKTENTGKARTQGLEIENEFQLTEALGLDISATHLDSKFVRIDNPFLSYLVGRDTPRAPRWAGILTLTYEKPVSAGLSLLARGMISRTGSHYVGSEIPSEKRVPGYSLIDASIGVRGNQGDWDLLLWCSNCTDETYRTIFFNTTFQPGTYSSYLGNPRLYGLTFRARF